MGDDGSGQSFWGTLPGILTATAAFITAVTGAVAVFLANTSTTPTDDAPGAPIPSPASEGTSMPARSTDDEPQVSTRSLGESYLLRPHDEIDVETGLTGSDVAGVRDVMWDVGEWLHVYGTKRAVVDEAADAAACEEALQRRLDDNIRSRSELSDGLRMCMLTEDGNLAYLEFSPPDEQERLPAKVRVFT